MVVASYTQHKQTNEKKRWGRSFRGEARKKPDLAPDDALIFTAGVEVIVTREFRTYRRSGELGGVSKLGSRGKKPRNWAKVCDNNVLAQEQLGRNAILRPELGHLQSMTIWAYLTSSLR